MFDERAALKMRLEQIQDLELRIIQEFQKERDLIFHRIRELDDEVPAVSVTAKPQTAMTEVKKDLEKSEGIASKTNNLPLVQSSKRNHTDLTKEAIKVLKNHSASISGKELVTTVEKNTGRNISNVTQFMNRIMSLDSNVKKPYRGQYIYEELGSSAD
ncbi:Rok-like winged helix domain-containing protein [Metabacillus arenae]|uniref:Competence protein ComK n=1 Tax=Metabacillus arenae TaxID=2771434 RepID=A0A926NMZ3_9BACI|nr:competence protein ComK [Metabacillus arenae]MBD1382883.1 competence protein ComK [Metabacillus arenae]